MAGRANPAFAGGVLGLTLVALGYALVAAPLQHLTYIHVMSGILWTGIDIFIGAVLGPVVGGLDEEASADVFRRLTPKTTFLLPSMAILTIGTGITLARRVGLFDHAGPWLALFTAVNLIPALALIAWRLDAWRDWRWQLPFAVAALGSLSWVALTVGEFAMTTPAIALALAIVTVLSVQGFGVLLPGEVRVYLEMTSENPDPGVITTIGQQNAKLGGVQGLLQLGLIGVMVLLRYGGL
ncbi:MAG: hypothetical protein ABEH61_02535 [Haloarculaceae archaeon]